MFCKSAVQWASFKEKEKTPKFIALIKTPPTVILAALWIRKQLSIEDEQNGHETLHSDCLSCT